MTSAIDGRTIDVGAENFQPQVKKPANDKYTYRINYVPWLATGDTITSTEDAVVTVLTGAGSGPTISSISHTTTSVDVTVTGGSAGWGGRIDVRAITTLGERKRQRIYMQITDDDTTV